MSRLAAILCLLSIVRAEILTPPYFNLALGKRITATATCGDEGQELYCKLVGANADHDEHVIQGQVCDTCDLNNDAKKHPPEYAVDGLDTWWQSPPLSRGMKYNEVNLTIDLGQEFHVAYVFVRMGNSPRPGLWVLEKSMDYGKTFKPWQYFSDSPQDCERYFGKESLMPITNDDSVICSTEYSKIVPLEGGEIPISLLNSRPSANKYFNSSVLQEWTRATNVRLRLLRTKNLLGHLMSVARQDPTVTRRYFYSIKDISIGGRCMCNGHADTCDPAEPNNDASILKCQCQHNTCGTQCNECCSGFEQKKWRISQSWNRFACEPCNCHNHSTECEFDPDVDEKRLSLDIHGRYEGGGVCKNCQHNTEGINCNKCVPTFYRPYGKRWGELDVCKPCNCDPHFSTGNCEEETGRCECRVEFNPPDCDSCSYGYYDYPNCKPCPCNLNGTEDKQCTPSEGLCRCKYNYAGNSCEICADGYYSPECTPCKCNMVGSVSSVCDKDSGNCTCKSKYAGRTCDACEAGYYNYPACKHCNCDVSGTQDRICDDVDGTCICKEGFGGARCDQCISGYYMEVRGRERLCVPCNCDPKGSTSTSCSLDGKCNCLGNFGGKQCDQCSPGYYKYPECLPCNCDQSGSIGSTCDDNAICHCKPNFDGAKCDRCMEQFYNYPACEECNCDPRGVTSTFAGCGSVPAGELCQCKERVQGRICNECKPLFWNLQEYNPLGCEECECHLAGTLGGLGACDTKTGQCVCKPHTDDRQCGECKDGFYRLTADDAFGCTECDCDPGGSFDLRCDKKTGQCHCHSRIEGRRCDRPIRAHYFPTLHQFRYELEDSVTRSGPVRYRSQEKEFPGFSWKGYVKFSPLQNEVINEVYISSKSSIYRMVLHYNNPLTETIAVSILSTPESPIDTQQKFVMSLKPTTQPQLATVLDSNGGPAPFVMNPGNWTITFKTPKEIMLDYFVLVPQQYYEATVLTKRVDKPCAVGDRSLCRQFAYPSLQGRPTADIKNIADSVTQYITDDEQLAVLQIGESEIPLLSDTQNPLNYNMRIEPNGPYVLLVEYITPVNSSTTDLEVYSNNTIGYTPGSGAVTIRFESGPGSQSVGIVNLNDCPYTTPCRQVALDLFSKIQVVNVETPDNTVQLIGEQETLVGIKSIVAIPYREWNLDYVTAKLYCLRSNGKCVPATFRASLDYKKVEVESGEGGERETRPSILDSSAVVVNLNPDYKPLRVETKVSKPDNYMVMIHYYQPDNPGSNIGAVLLIDNSTKIEVTAKIEHCPSNSGCRALLIQGEANQFYINDNITITFNAAPNQNVWVDYILLPRPVDASTALKESSSVDYTRQFIDKCANNHYYIADNDTGFCRDSMFTITADYNSGALSCFCDFRGSTELECDTFGGQCPCKPNVIGRTCSACRPGYYGFPDCRECTCPINGICDDSGQCICPKNVEGENCDHCMPFTFNYDMTRGCDDCNCNPLGVVANQLQCDRDNGNCMCKNNIVGRTCSQCTPGHYAFPECERCYCDLAGSTEDVCDQTTALCHCKYHVTGQACDTCKEGYFNLQPSNFNGCTKCYCFERTTRCLSSTLSWAELIIMDNWRVVNVEENKTLTIELLPIAPSIVNESAIGVDLTGNAGSNHHAAYFEAPLNYLGKRLTSYGGYLTYSIYYTSHDQRDTAVPAADVIIGSGNTYIVHYAIDTPIRNEDWTHSVRISEEEFTNLDGSTVSREQIMNILVNVTSIYIRAGYVLEAFTTRLSAVSLDIAIEGYSEDRRATSVEECQCPKGYRGLSCEQCAEGHYRLSTGPFAGACLPCMCNSHTNQCDVNTGVCLNCADNTMGDHCEQCIVGYHGNATNGKPNDCLICACPMPTTQNNFAIGCDLSENGSLISCDCKPGYGGARCEYCAAGYYGEPEVDYDYCKPCNCSGNINLSDPGSCDSHTGDCLKCVNNTSGQACNLCAPGFYGDAVLYKNCTACSCDEFGMDFCDSTTGTCVCREGVIGDRCDKCAPNHYGIESGMGCTPCDCGLASLESQCDMQTGQCKCAKGVTGKHCEMCAAGYWNYTKFGCDHCNCNTGYSLGFMCNADGHCQCLPGVIGEKCDRCPERWVLIPAQGCLECDSCTDALIFSVEDLADRLRNETSDFKGKADSFFTTQRLNYIKNQTDYLTPKVQELQNSQPAIHTNLLDAVLAVETDAKSLLRSAEFAATDSDKQISRAADLAAEADAILSLIRSRAQDATDGVQHVTELATGLETSQRPKVENATLEATQLESDIRAMNLDPKKLQADNAFTNATDQLERMNVFVQPVNLQAKTFESRVNQTRELKKKMDDMLEFIDLAQNTSDWVERLTDINRKSKLDNKVLSVTNLNTDAMQDLIAAAGDLNNASYYNVLINATTIKFDGLLSNLTDVNTETKDRIEQWVVEIPDLQQLTGRVEQHAKDLKDRADNLRQLAEGEQNKETAKAFEAASAYTSIVHEIKDAKDAADNATTAINVATNINSNLAERVTPTLNRSQDLLKRAVKALDEVELQLARNQSQAEQAIARVKEALESADDEQNAIDLALPQAPQPPLAEESQKADDATAHIQNALHTLSAFRDDLSTQKDSVQTLPKTAHDASKHVDNIKSLLTDISSTKGNIESQLEAVARDQAELKQSYREADERRAKLQELVDQARAIVNRIQVGVTFKKQTTLQPRLPDTVDEMSTTTHVSAYFRTKRSTGLLMYLGNPKGTNLRRTKSDDYMIVGISNGYPYVVMDIGDNWGPEGARLTSDKKVDDNKWYQLIVDRVGRNIKLSIRETLDDGSEQIHSRDAVLPGTHTIFNLDKDKSKLFVGGVPGREDLPFELQNMDYRAFEGQIEELVIGDTPVGLWNFENATDLQGARQRDKLITSQSGPQEYRFNGRSHVTMNARFYQDANKNHVLLFFRTYAPDGLIYLVGNGNRFFNVQMQGGKVYLQVSLGNTEQMTILGTDHTYNDGKWHRLDATRINSLCSIRVDSEIKKNKQDPIVSVSDTRITLDTMNFGGNNMGIIQVADTGFDGCMRQISIEGVNVDLTESKESVGMAYGCQFASLVSLSGSDSFLRFENVSSENLQLTLKFKTSEANGLIFVYVGRTQTTTKTDSISLSLVNGALDLRTQSLHVSSWPQQFNDSQWHVVTITHGATLTMVVDDFNQFTNSSDTKPELLYILNGVLFVGGIQDSYVITSAVPIGSRRSFRGCIADATVNGIVLNLLTPYTNSGVTFARCGTTVSTGGVSTDTNVAWVTNIDQPDVLPLPPLTTSEPVHMFTSKEWENTPPVTTILLQSTTSANTFPPPPRVSDRPPPPPAPTRPPPQPEPGCALAYDASYGEGNPEEGYRFGTRNDSRIEYASLPGRQLDGFDLTVTFRTFDVHGGLVFYAQGDQNDHLALYLKDGKVHLSFNCGTKNAYIESSQTYNDTEWHTITVVRANGHGKLAVDGERIGDETVPCRARALLSPPFSYGGLRNVTETVATHLDNFYQPFKGCLKGLMMNGQYVTDVLQRVNSLRCTDQVEAGVYFGPSSNKDSNYLKLMENFKVGFEISISMEIKPRNSTGLLLSVHGRRDFMVLELLENEVVANVENGMGPFHASYKLGNKFSLCDGNWHKIHAVKSRHVVSVGVDGHFSDAGLGRSGSTDTRSALYIGGHERPISKVRGVRSKRGFTGCIRNIAIKEKPLNIPLSAAGRNTHIGVCPNE